jgi:hypothetical protein
VHPEARQFAHNVLSGKHFGTVVEVGGRDINGRITDSFTSDVYLSLDLSPGPNVDIVTDALDWSPDALVDLVICMEVLEHEPRQRELIEHMLSWLADDGALLITAGGEGRAPHSAIDGGPLRDGEPYKNLDAQTVIDIFKAEKLFPAEVHYNAEAKDLYAFGVVQVGDPGDVENTVARVEAIAEPVAVLSGDWSGEYDEVIAPPSGDPGRLTGGYAEGRITPHQCPEDCGRVDGDRWRELHKIVEIAGTGSVQ